MTPSVLAEFLSVRRSVVTRVLANLEDRGFIERQTSSEDGRSQVLRITEPGIVVSEYIEKIFHDEMLEAIDFLEDDHATRMLAGLDVLRHLSSNLEASRKKRGPLGTAPSDEV